MTNLNVKFWKLEKYIRENLQDTELEKKSLALTPKAKSIKGKIQQKENHIQLENKQKTWDIHWRFIDGKQVHEKMFIITSY